MAKEAREKVEQEATKVSFLALETVEKRLPHECRQFGGLNLLKTPEGRLLLAKLLLDYNIETADTQRFKKSFQF